MLRGPEPRPDVSKRQVPTEPEPCDRRPRRLAYVIRVLLLLGVTIGSGIWVATKAPIPQNPAYHNFADQRTLIGVPHFWNVISNAPFFFVGSAGLWLVCRSEMGPEARFVRGVERLPYLVFFAGVTLTAFGSTYYHLAPTNERLMWDRLPMATAFTALCSGIIADRLGPRIGVALLPVLVAAGILSVLYWRETDDLRPYYFVQFFPAAGIPLLILLFRPRYTGTGFLFLTLFWYILAKVCEYPYDRLLYAQGRWLSGHTLKHLFAAVAIYCILRMVWTRRPVYSAMALLGIRGPRGQNRD
jgi:hypothetical protein